MPLVPPSEESQGVPTHRPVAPEWGETTAPRSFRSPPSPPPLLPQIFVWEQSLEHFQMDLFRYRCYLASLQGGELPNPKRLLAFASRPTKVAMGRLGIFSVSSFHALVSGRGQASEN